MIRTHLTDYSQGHNVPAIILDVPGAADHGTAMLESERAGDIRASLMESGARKFPWEVMVLAESPR